MSKRYGRRPCPHPMKTPFGDQAHADLALAAILDAHNRAPIAERVPVRSYECQCGKWHLTSQRMSYADRPTVTEPVKTP